MFILFNMDFIYFISNWMVNLFTLNEKNFQNVSSLMVAIDGH